MTRAIVRAVVLPLLVIGIPAMLLASHLMLWLVDRERVSVEERARRAGL